MVVKHIDALEHALEWQLKEVRIELRRSQGLDDGDIH